MNSFIAVVGSRTIVYYLLPIKPSSNVLVPSRI
jgi:hypothetical protein